MAEGQGSRRWIGARVLVVVALALSALVSLGLALRGCEGEVAVGETSGGPVDVGPPRPPLIHEGVTLSGAVRIEEEPRPAPSGEADEAADAGEAGAERGADPREVGAPDEASAAGEDAGTGAGQGDAPAIAPAPASAELRPPLSCTVIAWSAGERLGEPVHCDREGNYRLELARAPATVAVEILVPGYLRAVLEATPASGAEVTLPTVALGPASHLTGQVIDGRGQPVADVRIQARPRPDLGEPEPWRIVSAADGRFRLDTLPSGPIVLEASRDGYAPTVVESVAPEDAVIVVLDGLRDLAGDVLGTPEQVAHARVRIEGSSIWPPLEIPVAADGSFVVPNVTEGIYGLVAEAPADRPGAPEYASIPLENVTPDMQVSLALIEALRVPVQVRDPQGAPVAGARVTLGGSSIGILQRIQETGADGVASVGPVVPGPYLVHADADGYLPSETIAVDAQIDVPLPTIELTLVKPGRILGQVVDEDGQSVVGAQVDVESDVLYSPGEALVRARTLSALLVGGSLGVTSGLVPPIPLFDEETTGPWIEGRAQSDGEGRFFLDGLVPGTYRLRAIHERHAASAVIVIPLRPGELRGDVLLILQRGQPLTGRLRDTNGQPIAGARVELDDGLIVFTDELGVFDAGLHRGPRRLVVRAPGMIPQVIEANIGERAVDLERTLSPATGAIEGRLRDANGRPIMGARIALFPDDGISATEVTYSDDRGLFAFAGLTPGGAVVEVDHPDYAPLDRRLRVPTTADGRLVELGLSAGWWITVHVRADGSGDPIAGAKVRVGAQLVITDAAGDATIRRLADDRVSVDVEAAGWVRERVRVDRPEDGDAELTVDLEEGAGMEGSVQDERGEPVARARISIRDRRSGEILAEILSDADGTWRADRLPEGDVIVEAAPPEDLAEILAPVSENSDVLRGRVTRGVDLRFDRL